VRRSARGPGRWIALAIVLAVAVAYAPVVRHGFVNFDDPDYVVENGYVRRGLTRAGLAWAFAGFHAANWHPLTWLSHMLDCQLFGLEAGAHHATSVLLHAGSALVLFAALFHMTAAPWRSGAVAALFALHPLRVESVAWISERKDVLAAFWWMVALYGYVRYAARPTWARYVAVLLAFVAGLLSKPMVMTLPFALLLLDVWPLRRLALGPRVWLEKLPLLALAAAASVVNLIAQQRGGAITPFAVHPLSARLANAILSYVAYLGMTLWPTRLAIFYPSRQVLPAWEVAAAALVLGAVTAAVARRARREPWLLVGWLWYLGTLVPVAGIIRAGDQAMADRFTYLPHVGLFITVVWGLGEWTAGLRLFRILLPAVAAVVLAGCVATTRVQLRHWRDSLALFGHALAVTKDNAVAHTNYGFALLEQGRTVEALDHFQRAVALRPRYAKARLNLGVGLGTLGRSDEAVAEYREAIRLDPQNATAHYDLGLELAERGRLDEAIAEYVEAVRLEPSNAKAHNNLGVALARQGRLDEALARYEAALTIDPGVAAAHNNAAVVLERLGRPEDALAHYREAVRLTPEDARAHFNLGAALDAREHAAEAIGEYREALRLAPELADSHLALGDTLAKQGRGTDALAEYRAALAARPGWAAAEARAAWIIATAGAAGTDAGEAVRLAERARDATDGRDPEVLRTLAAAYAAAGRFRDAAEVARRTLVLARAAGLQPLAAEVARHLAAYEAGRAVP